jgi:hypothetical protein
VGVVRKPIFRAPLVLGRFAGALVLVDYLLETVQQVSFHGMFSRKERFV